MRLIQYFLVLLGLSLAPHSAFSLMVSTDTKLVLDQDYLPILIQELETAQKSIDIIAYSFSIDSKGELSTKSAAADVAKRLVSLKARRPWLQIRVYLEGTRNTSTRNLWTGRYLNRHGIQVVFGGTHAKGFCIDGERVLFGSTNLSHQSMIYNNEANVLVKDPNVGKSFTQYFDHYWSGGDYDKLRLPPPLLADGDFKPALLQMISSAKTTLEFSMYIFNDSDIAMALIEAHQRGVRVRGYLNQDSGFGVDFVRQNHEMAKRLKAAGIKDIHFDIDRVHSHSKYLIRDRTEIALGTGNWSRMDVSKAPQLYIQIQNSALATELAARLAYQIQHESSEPLPLKVEP